MNEGSKGSLIGDLTEDGRGVILLVVSFGWFLSLGSRLVYPVLLPQMTVEFDIDYSTAGIVLSVLWLAYAAMSVPGGVIADRIGERRELVIATSIAMIGLVMVVLAPSFGIFVLATFVLGSGCGMFGTTGTTILSDVFTDRDTTAIGLSQVAGTLGTIVLPVMAGLIVVAVGWRPSLGYIIPGFLLVTVGLWIVVPPSTSPRVNPTDDSFRDTIDRLRATFANRSMILVIVGMASIGFVFQGLTGFLPVYLIEIKGFSQRGASLLFGLLFTAMIAAKLVSGLIADRYGKRFALTVFAGISAPAVLGLPFVDSTGGLVGLVWCAGMMLGFSPVAMAYVISFIPNDIQGSVFGLVRSSFIGIGVLGPPIVGFMADGGRFDSAMILLGLIGFVAVLSTVYLPNLDE